MPETTDVQKEETTKKNISEIFKDAFKELGETFVAFVKAPRALWGVNVPYVIEGLVYFGILTVLGKFCSENVGLSDLQAGWVYSFVTGGITLAMVVLGGYSDKIGVRASLILAFMSMVIGRVLVALSNTVPFANGFLSRLRTLSASCLCRCKKIYDSENSAYSIRCYIRVNEFRGFFLRIHFASCSS